jgi:Tol biopolymer transport system component
MFRLWRFLVPIVLLVLLVRCGTEEPTPPAAPDAAPVATLVAPTSTSAPTRTEAPPTPTSSPAGTPSPSSEGVTGLIAYSSDQDGDFEIWVMDAGGGDQRQLTDNDAMDHSPAWSPDGDRIAFVSDRDGNDEIYLMKADGGDVSRLTETVDASESFPAWSPDGTRISFDSDRDGNWDIYLMASDGSDVRRLTDHASDDWISSWSPAGDQIVFESRRDGNYEIYVIGSDGGEVGRLTDNRTHDGFPAWSPVGTAIAFMSQRDGNYDIYTMPAPGSPVQATADEADHQRITHDRGQDSDPAWSPDGEWLAYVSDRDGNDEIYIIKTDGTDLRQLTDNGAQNWSPAWQPSGRSGGGGTTWVRRFEGDDYGAFFDIVLTGDGNALAVGATNHLHLPPYSGDALLIKLTLEGELLWERTWGGDEYEQAWSIAPAGDGGFFVFGETGSYGAGDRDFFLLKIASDGAEEWFQTYGREHREWPFGMLPLADGDLLLHGFTESTTGRGRDQYALRVAPDGEVVWDYVGEGPEDEFVLDAVETAQGDLVLVVGVAEDGKLVNLNADGEVQWSKRYELDGWQFASQIVPTDDGGYLLAGFSMSPSRQADTWLARCTADGELEWETSFGDPSYDDYAQSLFRLQDGSYLIGAIANGMLLNRVDGEGKMLWKQSLMGQQVHGAEAVIELEDGGLLVAGFVQLVNGRSYDAIILRTDAEGRVQE